MGANKLSELRDLPAGPFTDPTGAFGRDIGKEFDIELQYKHDANTTFSVGYSVFWPGNYVKNIVTNAGQPYDKQTWFFVLAGIKF